MQKKIFFILILLTPFLVFSQGSSDSLFRENKRSIENILDSLKKIRVLMGQPSGDLTFTGTSAVSDDERKGEDPKFTISGYVSAYYAHYSDSVGYGNFQKFPTTAPKSDAFSLNLVQLSAKYSSRTVRAIATFHYGDMPASVWSPVYNYIQEANAGIRIHKKFWLDAGFFRTHIGLESIQPRENITSSLAVVTYNEPYYLAGAKLSYLATDKLILQINAFNSYNGFTETNKKKAFGFSALYDVSSKLSLAFNALWNDDSADSAKILHGRLYNNIYMVYKTGRFILGVEGNYAFQQNTSLDTAKRTKTAQLWSMLASAKYKLVNKFYLYGRVEYYSDPEEMLTGAFYNGNGKQVGLNIGGVTLGMEWKPLSNCYLRLEGRTLQTQGDEKIFKTNGTYTNTRYEVISSLGVWF